MSFELYLQAEEHRTRRLPSRGAVRSAFAAHLRSEDDLGITVGTDDADSAWISIAAGEGPVSSLMVSRPVAADWLWAGLYRLLQEFDLYMFWPGDELRFVTARRDVPLPAAPDVDLVVITDAAEIPGLIAAS